MVAASHFGSSSGSKIFAMSPEEENYRTKLRRIDSPYMSTDVPVLVPSFCKPASSVFTFTATKNAQSSMDPLIRGSGQGISRMRCRVCNRPKVTKASSTIRKLWPISKDDNTGQVNPFGMSNFKFQQLEPSRFFMQGGNAKFAEGLQPQYIPAVARSTSMACPTLTSTSSVPSDNQYHPVNKLEDTDQIVQKASEMVKLLESHIAALQLSAQALKTPSESMIPVEASPMNSYSNFKNEEPVNPFKPTKLTLMETSMRSQPPLYQSSPLANSFGQHSPGLHSLSPAIICPCQTLSPAPSWNYIPSQGQSPALSQIPERSPVQILSSIPSQKPDYTPSLNVKNIVQRLESLTMSPSHCDKTVNPTPNKFINGFTVSPLRTQGKLEKDNMYKTPIKAVSVVSSSSGFIRPSRPSNTSGQTHISALTKKARLPTSKLIRPHRLSPRQQSSVCDDDSGSSISSSSWTTTQQSGSGGESANEESNEYSYSSSASNSSEAESSRTPESEYSVEATSSSATSPMNRPRLSRPPTFNRRRSKKHTVSNERPISRLRKIKNKLGLIFHHHHHHHHHHHVDDAEKPKPSTKKLQVVRQPHQAAEKMAVKRRDQQGHFRALINGLMRHVRVRKKTKKSKRFMRSDG